MMNSKVLGKRKNLLKVSIHFVWKITFKIFIKSLHFETTWVRENFSVSSPDNDPGTTLALFQGHCLWAQFAGSRCSPKLACLTLVCVWQPLVYDAKNLSGYFYYGKKNWATSLLGILCFQWNYGFRIIENVAEVCWGVYSIENASIKS